MKIYGYGTKEITVTEDTVILSRDHFESLLLTEVLNWRKQMDDNIFGDSKTAADIYKEMNDVWLALITESNERAKAREAQMDIPF